MPGHSLRAMLELVEFKNDSTLLSAWHIQPLALELVEFKNDSTFHPVSPVVIIGWSL